jgi:single-strand DNA-binding protein
MMNSCSFIGNLGKDPEATYTANGLAISNFSIATTETRKDKEGNKETKTEWINIVAFGKLADICNEYLVKGKQVYIEGKFTTDKWEDKDGNTRYSTNIIAKDMKMLGSKSDGNQSGTQENPPPPDLDDIEF